MANFQKVILGSTYAARGNRTLIGNRFVDLHKIHQPFREAQYSKKSIGSHSRQKKRGIYKFLQLELREDTSDRDSVK
jgi:hypothetical protein